MKEAYLLIALILMATVVVGLLKVLFSSGTVEKLLALQLLVTTAVAVFLLLSSSHEDPALLDLALVTGLLTAIAAVGFIRYGNFQSNAGEQESE